MAVAGEIGKSVCRKWHSRTGLSRVCGTAIGCACPEGGLGIDGAVRLQGEWVNRPLLTSRFPALSLWPRLRPQQPSHPGFGLALIRGMMGKGRRTGLRPTGPCRVVNGSRLRFPKVRWLELTFRQRSSVHEARTLSPLQASLETCGHIVAGREPQVCSDAGCIPHSLRLLGRPLLGLGSLFR